MYKKNAQRPMRSAHGFGSIDINAVGVTFDGRQDRLDAVRKLMLAGVAVSATLVREPDNRFDRNAVAIAVRTPRGNERVGYLPADVASWIAPRLDKGKPVYVRNPHVVGSRDPGMSLGLRFELKWELDTPRVPCFQKAMTDPPESRP